MALPDLTANDCIRSTRRECRRGVEEESWGGFPLPLTKHLLDLIHPHSRLMS